MKKYPIFQKKTALVTGGSSGIGLAIACAMAEQGANVWLVARREQPLAEALECVKSNCSNAIRLCGTISADISDPEQAQMATAKVIEETGSLDILINSAGVVHPGYVQDLTLEQFRWMMDINYFGTVYMTKAALPCMLATRAGHIVNISSMAGFLSIFGYTAYGASKFAVRGFSDALRAELKPHGIRVSIVFPPDTDTPQLAYEKLHKPPETAAIAGNAKLMTAESVAREIMDGMSRGRYLILPGFDAKLFYWLSGWLGSGVFPVLDLILARSLPKKGRGK